MMASRIPENKIDEIRAAADIVEVISAYLPLKRRGRNFLGLCPFHNEKTPSFSVSPDRQIFHCFGCGKGGNVLTFLMEHEHLSFIEAVTLLADRYGIILPKYEKETDTRLEKLLFAHEVAAQFFQATLKDKRYREKIERYLYSGRELTPETIEKFQIGLAPEEWRGLIDYAARKDLKPEDLVEAGLAIRSEKRKGEYFDRFRLRLMIPIYNVTGKIIAFGGRALSKKEVAKYMNSPETPIYSKSHVLYGLHASKGAIRQAESAILVEGYFDFLSLFQAGIQNVVAVSGTAFTPQQARLLGRYAHKVYLFFDADSAGQNAALRSVEHFYNAGIEPMIATPPPGHDPDTLVRKFGATEVHQQLTNSLPYLAFRFQRIDVHALTLREKEQAVHEIKGLAGKIEDPLRREIFISSASEYLKLPAKTFLPGQPQERPEEPADRTRNLNLIESEFLSLFFMEPPLIETVWDDIAPDDLKGPGNSAIYAGMIRSYKQDGKIESERLSQELTGETERSLLTFIAAYDEWGKIDPATVVREYKRMILNRKREQQLSRLQAELAEAEKKGDRATAEKLTREIKYLLEKRR